MTDFRAVVTRRIWREGYPVWHRLDAAGRVRCGRTIPEPHVFYTSQPVTEGGRWCCACVRLEQEGTTTMAMQRLRNRHNDSYVIINAKGRATLNKGAVTALGTPVRVNLYHDPEAREIGIEVGSDYKLTAHGQCYCKALGDCLGMTDGSVSIYLEMRDGMLVGALPPAQESGE